MSLRLFVYYCAICGAWSGFFGWLLGKLLSPAGSNSHYGRMILHTSLVGMFLGLAVAFGLSLLDATFNLSFRQTGKVFQRVFSAVIVGIFAGLIGSFIGGSLFWWAQQIDVIHKISPVFLIIGWTIVGFLVGASIGFFEVLKGIFTGKDFWGSLKKMIKCLMGGTLGGILGGIIFFVMTYLATKIFRDKDESQLWSPTAIGFVALGACIGLLVGLAQVILKEAWIKVEAGFRPGREKILTQEKTSIGRAEGSDIPLFGDNGVEKTHAFIVLEGGRYYLVLDAQTPSGTTFINDQQVVGRGPLKAGDLIRLGGKSVLRFNERAKR